ncbi:hypothetical protein CHL78_008385 [Romboutsia weinsteinii]|uniref:Lipoprotein n=1 Tax=Romboutsia weinsteinii TaxID=2020949 RepID=A0A371J4P1_9FIRM|nr:hypothetical protein [Romboutsia weinsteinii]RDY27729.1 hypothetical protein CHL78_008385 [Romboutsia weinsteinii]
MKVKKIILAMVVSSISTGLVVGCAPSASSTDVIIYTEERVSEIKKDLSEKISESIEDSGLRVAEALPDGSFVLSLGNLEYSKEQPKQVLNYSMTTDDKKSKETLAIHCVKDYFDDEKLSESDKFIKAIYNIFKSLTDTKLTEKDFFDEVEKVFEKGEGNVELPSMGEICVQVSKIDKSTKILELRLNKEFILK